MRECLHVAGAGRLYSEASNVPHVARGRVSKVFVLIAYTIYIIGILSAGPHVAVRSLFPAEMNVPHVARNVWFSEKAPLKENHRSRKFISKPLFLEA